MSAKDEEGDVKMQEPDDTDAGAPSTSGTDKVVREIDVFLSPCIDEKTQLYVFQYPLRPHWRPYGVDERFLEVRVKPGQARVEMDLSVDTTSENYDGDSSPRLHTTKQTLVSSRLNLNTSYAVGYLKDDQLFVNPISAVVQLRPSLRHLDKQEGEKEAGADAEAQEEDGAGEEGGGGADEPQLVALEVHIRRRETERQEENRLHSHAYLKQLDEQEAWIPLKPNFPGTEACEEVRAGMAAASIEPLPFTLDNGEYLASLTPSRPGTTPAEASRTGDGTGPVGLSRGFLETLPLERRFEVLLTKGQTQVLEFDRLMKLAPPGSTEAEVLDVLSAYAVLVQGCWVAASCLRYERPVSVVRDFILLLFTKNRVVTREQLDELKVPKEMVREVLSGVALQRGAQAGWEFQESTDRSFIKRHPAIAKQQQQQWIAAAEGIRETAMRLQIGPGAASAGGGEASGKPGPEAGAGPSQRVPGHGLLQEVKAGVVPGVAPGAPQAAPAGRTPMAPETVAALPHALREVFKKHHVCNLQFLCQCLREAPISAAQASRPDAAAITSAVAASRAADAPHAELVAAVNKVAMQIHGAYFLPALGSPLLDPFRNVVIGMLRDKAPGSGLRKNDILELAKEVLRAEVPATVYQKVLKELCYTKGGMWVLKPGDGRPT